LYGKKRGGGGVIGQQRSSYLDSRLNRIRNLVEDLKYKEYLKKVEVLNERKAYLSTYRYTLNPAQKRIIIDDIRSREDAINKEELLIFK
jgi:hypothetical protein